MFKRFILTLLLLLPFLGGCSVTKVLVGNVGVYNQEGIRTSYYQDVIIHDETVREGEVLSHLEFRTSGDVEHLVEGTVVVDNLRWVDSYSSSYYKVYPYRYGPDLYIYYPRPPYRMMPPPPAPRPAPRPDVRPPQQPRPPQGGPAGPPPSSRGGRRR